MDLALLIHQFGGNVLARDVLRIGRCDLHRHVLDEPLEFLRASDEVGFAVHFDQYAELRASVDVASDDTLVRGASALLLGNRDAPLAQIDFGSGHVAAGLHQGPLALHESGTALVAEFLD